MDDSTVFQLAPHFRLQWEETQQAHVLLYPEGMITLNASAAEILQHVDGKASVETVLSQLQEKFPDQDISDDIKSFLGDAHERGWIIINGH